SVLDRIGRTSERYGFARLGPRAVEPLAQLLRTGDTSKEVYLLRRLQADDRCGPPGEASRAGSVAGTDEGELGLHLDLTVPFARYVLENAGKLHFPFRRYQIQKAWRGELPQEGPYRGFTQGQLGMFAPVPRPFHSG